MMETKGRRAPRVSGPIGGPAQPARLVEIPTVAAAPTEAPTEPPKPVEAAEPAETASSFADTAADSVSAPGVGTLAKLTTSTSSDDLAYFGRDAFAALAQSQAALAQGLEVLSAEMAGLALSGIDTATRAATKMLGVKTLSDAIEVNAGFACRSLDTLVGGSAKLSELGAKLAAETSRPILAQFGKGWIKASRLGS